MTGPTIDDVIDHYLQRGCPTCESPLLHGPGANPECSPECPLHCTVCGWKMWVVTDADAPAYEPGALIV